MGFSRAISVSAGDFSGFRISLYFTDSPYLKLTSWASHNKKMRTDNFFFKWKEMPSYKCEWTIFFAELMGTMPLTNWDHCNMKLLHLLAILIEYTLVNTYIMDFITHSIQTFYRLHIFSALFSLHELLTIGRKIWSEGYRF